MKLKEKIPIDDAGFLHRDNALKEIRIAYCPVDYLAYAARLEQAHDGDFPDFVLNKRCWYVQRLRTMAEEPDKLSNAQALNALKLMDRTRMSLQSVTQHGK